MIRLVKASLVLSATVLMCGGAAFAAEDPPIATAAPAMPPLTSLPGVAMPDPTADQIDAWLKADGSSVRRPNPNDADPLVAVPRVVHGEVGATVSNRGYSAYGAASMPLGQASELDVAVAGGHVNYPHGGSANPKSIAVGLYLDGRDVDNWLSRKNCGAPRWGVSLKDDPQVQADGSCKKAEKREAQDTGSRSHRRGVRGDTGYGSAELTSNETSAIGPSPAPQGTVENAAPTP